MKQDDMFGIGALARLTGLTAHTLRYYEAARILQPAARAANGHRRYSSQDVRWLEFVQRLKATGMPLAEIRHYAGLRAQGNATLQQRLDMLEMHQQRLAEKIRALAACDAALQQKVAFYRRQIASPEPIDATAGHRKKR